MLARLNDDALFGEVWNEEALDRKKSNIKALRCFVQDF